MSSSSACDYRERLTPSIGAWLAIAGFALFTYIALFVADPTVAAITAPIVLLAGLVSAWFTAPVVEVRAGELTAGQAHIPVDLLGPGELLNRAQIHRVMGVDYDPRTFACLRIGTGHAVWFPVVDSQDPTPAWLVSTRRPSALNAAVLAARS